MQTTDTDFAALAQQVKTWGRELGFAHVAITDTDLGDHAAHFQQWLAQGRHGEMAYMAAHGAKRWSPEQLVPGTCRVISVRMDYLPPQDRAAAVLADPDKAYISRYALGRDYHKLMRRRLSQLAARINTAIGSYHFRALVDSAPVLERGLAQKAGLGWIGKNTMLINSRAGSWFFLGEIYTDLPLPIDAAQQTEHCGSCTACIDVCPTAAIVAPHEVDARRCISYLTIELDGSIPLPLRPLIGNRIYGCDDCQLCCPWNKFAVPTAEGDFRPRHGLDDSGLIELFGWEEADFLKRTEGSPIRRIGYTRWLRNIAVALGNAPYSMATVQALAARRDAATPLVQEHIDWALHQQRQAASAPEDLISSD